MPLLPTVDLLQTHGAGRFDPGPLLCDTAHCRISGKRFFLFHPCFNSMAVGTWNLRSEQSSVFLACGSHRNSLAHWTPPSFKDFPAQWGQLTMFPWDCVFPTATQAPGKLQACEYPTLGSSGVGDEVRARTQDSGRFRLDSKKLCRWTNAFPS